MAGILDKGIGVALALLIIYLVTSVMIMPFFSSAWRYCQARVWNADVAGAGTNCSTPYTAANTSAVTASPHTESGLTSDVATDTDPEESISQWCLNCDTPGGYRTTIQGLVLLVLAIGFIAFAIMFLPKRKL